MKDECIVCMNGDTEAGYVCPSCETEFDVDYNNEIAKLASRALQDAIDSMDLSVSGNDASGILENVLREIPDLEILIYEKLDEYVEATSEK